MLLSEKNASMQGIPLPPLLFINVLATVGVVLTTKQLFLTGAKFPTALLVCHQASIVVLTQLMQLFGLSEKKYLPWKETLQLAFFEVLSIVALNLSLLHNSVGTYQLLKLLNAPVMCIGEYILLGKRRGFIEMSVLTFIVLGVGFVTVTDVTYSQIGVGFGLSAVFGTAAHQVLVKRFQAEHDVSGFQFMASQSPFTCFFLFPIVFLTDDVHALLKTHVFTVFEIGLIATSCVCVFAICVSIVYIISLTSAVTYQVLGHVKTSLIVLAGVVLLSKDVSSVNVVGMVAVLIGCVIYSRLKN
eukprot:PhM_4_TR15099/c0_g2_i1/m.71843/K15285/SLC35E3; solute carrier family 35, member E3